MKKKFSAKSQQETKQQPFFARFLENQELAESSGGNWHTTKYPSDNDEWWP